MERTLPVILLILVSVVSGCTTNMSNLEMAIATESVREFLDEYPNAKVVALHMDKNYMENIIDNLKSDCGEQMTLDSYWKVTVNDADSNLNVTIWIEESSMETVCVIREQTGETNKTGQEIRKNCRELDGYLCNPEDQCALPWLNSSDSYCCPISCNTCTQEVLDDCKIEEECIEVVCGPQTDFECEYRDITPCANNGVCEEGEYEGPVTYCDDSSYESAISSDSWSSDCPNNCNDGDPNTADYYDFAAQKCEHYDCVGEEEVIDEEDEPYESESNYESVSDGKVKYFLKGIVDPKFSQTQEGWRFVFLELDIENIDAEEDTYWYSMRPDVNYSDGKPEYEYYLQVFRSDGELQRISKCQGDCKPIKKGESASVALGFSIREDVRIEKIVFNMPTKNETFSEIEIIEDAAWEHS